MMHWLLRAFAAACLACVAVGSAAQEAAPQQVLVMLALPPAHFRADGNYSGGYGNTAARAALRRVADALSKDHGLRIVSEWPLPAIGVDCYVMDVPAPRRASDVARELSGRPHVSWAQPMQLFDALGHDDPLFALQPAAAQWQLAQLHETATGRGVRIAVIDSGVQADHPDLAGQLEARVNFVADGPDRAEVHGTGVAGIIAARADNHVGIAGVAPGAQLLALRACSQAGDRTSCNSLGLALALNAALDQRPDIVNLSLGGPPDPLVQRLIEAATAHGITVVAAARRDLADGGFPASLHGVVAVCDAPGARGGMFVAPGTDVLTTLPGSRWGAVSGPSYSAAHVSGLLALIAETRTHGRIPVALHAPLAASLIAGADGRIDACASLARASASCVCGCEAVAGRQPSAQP